MRVKLLKRMAGPDGNWPPGAVVELANEAFARLLVAGGFAEAVPEPGMETRPTEPAVETAARQPAERAVSKRGRRK